MSNKIYGGLIMDLNVISKLTKLAGYGYLSLEITNLMSDDQVTEFETPYAYYGELRAIDCENASTESIGL